MGRLAAGRFSDTQFLFYQTAKRRSIEILVIIVGCAVRGYDKPVMGDLFLAELL